MKCHTPLNLTGVARTFATEEHKEHNNNVGVHFL